MARTLSLANPSHNKTVLIRPRIKAICCILLSKKPGIVASFVSLPLSLQHVSGLTEAHDAELKAASELINQYCVNQVRFCFWEKASLCIGLCHLSLPPELDWQDCGIDGTLSTDTLLMTH